MRVQNMTSNTSGRGVANQFIIYGATIKVPTIRGKDTIIKPETGTAFQSYNTIIAFDTQTQVYLDEMAWDYSHTTGKYRNQFLGESRKETEAKIKSGEYILTDLNN